MEIRKTGPTFFSSSSLTTISELGTPPYSENGNFRTTIQRRLSNENYRKRVEGDGRDTHEKSNAEVMSSSRRERRWTLSLRSLYIISRNHGRKQEEPHHDLINFVKGFLWSPGGWNFTRLRPRSNTRRNSCVMMEKLPQELLWLVLSRVTSTADRNSFALACKRFYDVERHERRFLRTGSGMDPVEDALVLLCRRFPNLTTVDVSYSGWNTPHGRQMDDHDLAVLAENCSSLVSLSLSFCCFVTDSGLGNLSKCQSLRALKLNFMPRITGVGLLSLVTGCSGIKKLELNRCMYVNSVQWLQFLGTQENLESLCVRNCRGVGELDLSRLGWGWRVLRRLVFEVDGSSYRYPGSFGDGVAQWIDVSCEQLEVLVLANCIVTPGRGLSSMFSRCCSLVELELNMCKGLVDEQLISVAERCKRIKSLSLRLCSSSTITNATLEALATYSQFLEKLLLCFGNGELPVTMAGIVLVLRSCSSLRELVLDKVSCLNNLALQAVCSSPSLETLEVIECDHFDNNGLSCLADSKLKKLRICRCRGVTQAGVDAVKLQRIEVEVVGCPYIV